MARRPVEPDYDDDAPWLSSVEDEQRGGTTYVPRRRLIGGIAVFLVLLAVILGGLWFVTKGPRQNGSSGTYATPEEAPLIAADPGPYKVAPGPDDPQGADVDQNGSDMHGVSQGEAPAGALDANATPETPGLSPDVEGEPTDLLPPSAGASVTAAIPPVRSGPVSQKPIVVPTAPVATIRPPAPVAAKPVVPPPVTIKPLPKVAAVPPGAPAPKPVMSTGSVALQLGAFSTSAKANSVWDEYAKRFKYLGGLGKAVQSVERNGATLYRLRATGVADRATADDLCARLKVAGVECVVAK